ncbi:DegT/DnrJ/EryC1/StrS family aminotransferase [Candidatus Poribacteria bacterium]|nr:DegT/DnrJ/EryC1/StrS family aminotransferase [Candidatus Poribacteria bacterium]
MAVKLAKDGGTPVHTTGWPHWPQNPEALWDQAVGPALREVFLGAVEGLPGTRAKQFAANFARYIGTEYGVMMPHGTDSIMAALTGALDLDGFEDSGEAILPNYTFIATASAALDRRFTVTFVDIDPETFTISPSAVEEAITDRTRVIVPVHIGGHPAHMDAINEIAKRRGLKVVEDCAQAHGAEYMGRKVGSLGDAGAFSFQSSKNLTSGEGGMVTTNDADTRDRVVAFMDVGRRPGGARWEYPRIGWNYRPSEYLAALLDIRLAVLEEQTQRRNENANYLIKRFDEMPGITPPRLAPYTTLHGYHLFMMKYDSDEFGGRPRGEFLEALAAEGIACTSGYGQPLSREAGLQHLSAKYPGLIREMPCPNAEEVCAKSFWFYQNMLLGTRDDMNDIVEAIAKIQQAFRER